MFYNLFLQSCALIHLFLVLNQRQVGSEKEVIILQHSVPLFTDSKVLVRFIHTNRKSQLVQPLTLFSR